MRTTRAQTAKQSLNLPLHAVQGLAPLLLWHHKQLCAKLRYDLNAEVQVPVNSTNTLGNSVSPYVDTCNLSTIPLRCAVHPIVPQNWLRICNAIHLPPLCYSDGDTVSSISL